TSPARIRSAASLYAPRIAMFGANNRWDSTTAFRLGSLVASIRIDAHRCPSSVQALLHAVVVETLGNDRAVCFGMTAYPEVLERKGDIKRLHPLQVRAAIVKLGMIVLAVLRHASPGT